MSSFATQNKETIGIQVLPADTVNYDGEAVIAVRLNTSIREVEIRGDYTDPAVLSLWYKNEW